MVQLGVWSALFRVRVSAQHTGKALRLPSAFTEQGVYSPNQVESQVTEPFSMLLCLPRSS